MEEQLLNIINPDTSKRKQASDNINRICKENPENTCKNLLQILANQSDPKLMELASLVLHKNVLSKNDLFK